MDHTLAIHIVEVLLASERDTYRGVQIVDYDTHVNEGWASLRMSMRHGHLYVCQ